MHWSLAGKRAVELESSLVVAAFVSLVLFKSKAGPCHLQNRHYTQ